MWQHFLNLPSASKLPSLKILHLSLATYNDNSDWRLLSGCPVLEDLYVYRFEENSGKVIKFKIRVPTLKRLKIEFIISEFEHPDYELEINTPALEYFDFRGDLRNAVFLEKLSCLVEANVNVFPYEDYGDIQDCVDIECYGDRVVGLLRELYNVKLLSLCNGTTECLKLAHDYDFRMFHNLVRLNYEVDCCYLHVLRYLLEQSPNLEILVVDKLFPRCFDATQSVCLKEPLHVPTDLSPRLASFYFSGFKGLKDELKFVRCILKKARVLKKMTFKYDGNYQNEVEEKRRILKKVSNFPRWSPSCQIAFE